jgi:Ca2+-transporting ATPase
VSAGNVLLVKGAAECVLDRCDRVMLPDGKVVKLTPALRSSILSCVDEMADDALRILAMARRFVCVVCSPGRGEWSLCTW